jgi:hypothetical protein
LKFQACPIQLKLNHKRLYVCLFCPGSELLRVGGFVLASHGDKMFRFGETIRYGALILGGRFCVTANFRKKRMIRREFFQLVPEQIKFHIGNLSFAAII